jgi:hypothetical protein
VSRVNGQQAALTLDVRAWPEGMPVAMTEAAKMVGGVDDALVDPTSTAAMPTSAEVRARDAQLPLRRGVFPRPFAITSLPIRDISMQSVEGEPGDFKLYQVRRRRRGKDDRRMVGGSRPWRMVPRRIVS